MKLISRCVTPAEAGVQSRTPWIPAFAGMTAGFLLAGSLILSVSPVQAKTLKKGKTATDDTLQQADQTWQKRDQPLQTETAIALWERALQLHPERTDLYISLTKACGRAYRQSSDTKHRRFWADEARSYGAKAVEKNPSKPEAYAENAAALGQWAQSHKGIGSLKIVKQAVAQLQKAIELDPHFAFAHMLLAQFYQQSPAMFSIGDKTKALEQAKLAVEDDGNSSINRLTLGKIYLDHGDKTAAKEQLEKAVALTPPPDRIPETKSDQDDARDLLKHL
jgi:tetratricopeptide (TPR) repeat protein